MLSVRHHNKAEGFTHIIVIQPEVDTHCPERASHISIGQRPMCWARNKIKAESLAHLMVCICARLSALKNLMLCHVGLRDSVPCPTLVCLRASPYCVNIRLNDSSSAPQKNPMRLTLWALLALLFCFAQGCLIIPVPHTQRHADGVQGRVVDEDGMPVPNVTVISPAKKMTGVNVGKREAITDADGYFTLNPVRGWHWGYFIPFFVTGTGNVSIWPYFDPYLEGISMTSELHLFAEGFPEQKITPSHWHNPVSTWSPSVKGRESEFFIYNRVYVDDNWENIGHDDKASKVSKEGNTIVASEIMLHRQTTSNYLAAATHEHITDSLDVTSILLCEMYSPAYLTVKCVIQGTNPVATLFGNRFYHYDLRVITDTNLIATIVSELSAPAEISTLVIPDNREERLEDILCCMVLYSSSKPMRIGHVVKRDGTVLNTRIEWMGSSKGSLSFSQHTADTTWSVRSETIADLVREALPRKNDSKKGER